MTEIIAKAHEIYKKTFSKKTYFERAIFLSWYCSKGDCKFCYMSTQKKLIKNPQTARRSLGSIFAEVIIAKECGWNIEFLSGGYDSFSTDELLNITKTISEITGKQQWLNIGTLSKKELELFKPYLKGVVGTIECINANLHKDICPSKPIEPILEMFKECDKLGLKKAITIIIGLGETIEDFKSLADLIKKNKIDKITFYSLNPQEGTEFKESPPIDYYEQWIAKTRIEFPEISITAGAWYNKTHYFSRLLLAGANNFTKFPAIKQFNTINAKEIESELKKAKRTLKGTLTKVPNINIDKELKKLDLDEKLTEHIKTKFHIYYKLLKKEKNGKKE